VHKDLQGVVVPQVKYQVPLELKVPRVLKELKDLNRRFRGMSVLLVLKEHRDTLEHKEE
jgi:hypothetical protein